MSDTYFEPEPTTEAEPAGNPWDGHPEFEAAVDEMVSDRLDEMVDASFADDLQPEPDDAEAWQLLERVHDEQEVAEGELAAVSVLGELGVAEDKLGEALDAAHRSYEMVMSSPRGQQWVADYVTARGITAEQALAEIAMEALHVAADQHISPPPGLSETGLAHFHGARRRWVSPMAGSTAAEIQAAGEAARQADGDELAFARTFVSTLGGRSR